MQFVSFRHLVRDLWYQVMSSRKEALLGCIWDTHKDWAMHFKLSLSMRNAGYGIDGNKHNPAWERDYYRIIHVLVTTRNRVYVAVLDPNEHEGSEFLKNVSPALFKNTSNHDSCWHTDGLNQVQEEFHRAYEHCYGFLPPADRPSPAMAHIHIDLGDKFLSRDILKFVEVKRKHLGDHYFDGLESITPLRIKLTLEPCDDATSL